MFKKILNVIYSSSDNMPTSSSEVWKLLESIKKDPTLAKLRAQHRNIGEENENVDNLPEPDMK